MGTKPFAHQRKRAHALTKNYSAQRHGGNRGLNTQHVMRELRPGVWEDETKQKENYTEWATPTAEQGEEPTLFF